MKRPNGSGQITASIWFFFFSFALGVIAINAKVTDYKGDLDPDGLATRSLMGIASSGLFGIAILLLSVGWIIRAIYFLPGRDLDDAVGADPMDEGTDAAAKPNPAVSAVLIIIIIAVAGLIAQALLTARA